MTGHHDLLFAGRDHPAGRDPIHVAATWTDQAPVVVIDADLDWTTCHHCRTAVPVRAGLCPSCGLASRPPFVAVVPTRWWRR